MIRRARRIRSGALLLAVGFAVAVATVTAAPPQPKVYPERGPCIDEPVKMRRQHHVMLKHQRTITVHEGVRDAKVDLNRCIACHASPDTNSVAARPSDFCLSCHQYAAVKIDCFTCHQPTVAPGSAFLTRNRP